MKKALLSFIVFLAFSPVSFAKQVTFDFQRVDLSNFLTATYGEVLRKNVVQSPELVQQARKVSLRIAIDDDKLPAFLSRFLDTLGIQAQEVDGVVFLSPKSAAQAVLAPLPSPTPSPSPENGSQVLSAPLPGSSVMSPVPMTGIGAAAPVLSPLENKNVEIFSPRARRPEYLCGVVNALVGQGSCSVAGTDCLLRLDDVSGPKIMELLPRLDKQLPRVEVTATFLEFSNTGKDAIGLAVTANVLGNTLGINLGSQVTTGALSIKGANFTAILDALKTDTRFKQFSSPSGLLNSGERMNINIGDEVPTLGNIQQDNKGNAVQSVVYRNSGVSLDLVPNVIKSDEATKIEATIKGSVSSFSATSTGVNNSPTLSKREVSTVVTLDESEIVILGGLSGSRDSSSRSKLFGFVPWGYNDENAKTEILLMLTAKVSK